MHLAVDKDSRVHAVLNVEAEVLVLRNDSLVHLVDNVEVAIVGVIVSVDLVNHGSPGRTLGNESLHEEEIRTGR